MIKTTDKELKEILAIYKDNYCSDPTIDLTRRNLSHRVILRRLQYCIPDLIEEVLKARRVARRVKAQKLLK